MKVLSIGNSFSQDAERYLHRLAKADGVNMKTVNLYIGGCPLQRHYINMLDDNADYSFEFNGESTGIKVSIRQALVSDNWDVITLQQVSSSSAKFESYTPYIEALAEYVRKYCPKAKIMIHETWAYEAGSEKLTSVAGFDTPKAMTDAVCNAYKQAADRISADGIIPCGRAMQNATELGVEKIHRDKYHASFGVGRYILALTWYKKLTGRDISDNSFSDFDEEVTERERKLAIAAVNAAVK